MSRLSILIETTYASVGDVDLEEFVELSDDNTAMLSLAARSFNKCSSSCCCVLFCCLSWQHAQTFSISYENAKKFHGKAYAPQLPL